MCIISTVRDVQGIELADSDVLEGVLAVRDRLKALGTPDDKIVLHMDAKGTLLSVPMMIHLYSVSIALMWSCWQTIG
jgi:hypothetical protein